MKWLIFIILAFGFFWRLPLLTGSFWLDEAAQALESDRPLSQQLQIRDDFQPPLLHLLVHFELLISRSEWWLRLGASFIPGLLTIFVTYKIGEKIANKQVGLLAAFLLSSSSFHVFYSQELRPYALPAFLASLSWLILIHLTDHKKTIDKKKLFCFFLVTSAGLYTSYLYPFLLMAQISYVFFFHKKIFVSILSVTVAAGMTFLPWLPSFLGQLQAGQSLRQNLPGWQEVVSFDQLKSLLLIFGKFSFGVLDLQSNLFFLATSCFFISAIGILFLPQLKKMFKDSEHPPILFLSWLVLPIAFAWLISFFVPVLQPKRVLYCLPAFYLFLSWLIFYKHPSSKIFFKVLPILLITVLVSINIFSSIAYFTQAKYQREDWRGLHQDIVNRYSSPKSIAVFAFPAPFAPWQWYDDETFATFATGELTTDATTSIQNSQQLTEFRYILIFDYLRDLTDPQNKVLTQLTQYGYHEVDRITPSTSLGFVRIYAKSSDVVGLLDRSL